MKETYDEKQPRLLLCESGRAFLFNDEEEVKVTEQKATSVDKDANPVYEDVEVTKYQYNVVRFTPTSLSRDALIDGIIRTRYSVSEEMSLNRHKNNGDASYDAEWEAYDAFCEGAKKIVDEALAK